MKAKLAIVIGCIGILISSYVFAYGTEGCGSGNNSCQQGYCDNPESACACVDRGWQWNTCMSKEKYCKAFGDIGAL